MAEILSVLNIVRFCKYISLLSHSQVICRLVNILNLFQYISKKMHLYTVYLYLETRMILVLVTPLLLPAASGR